MSFWDDLRALDADAEENLGGVVVVYTPAGGVGVNVVAIPEDRRSMREDAGAFGDEMRHTGGFVFQRLALLTALGRLPEAGDLVTFDGEVYRLSDVEQDLSRVRVSGEVVDRVNRLADGSDRV
jgi:hypothetical protein